MKHYYKKALPLILLATITGTASAQTLRSSYFLEGSTQRHQLNPAFIGESGFFTMPMLGNINISMGSNVGLDNFLYKYNDPFGKYSLTTFMSSTVSSKEFLDNIKDHNKFDFTNDIDILSFGFKAWGGFNTFGIGLHTSMAFNLPSDLFKFMKEEGKQEDGAHYSMKNMEISSRSYMDISLGHARQVNERLTVGGKLKFLVGLANAQAKFTQMDMYMSKDKWMITADGEMNLALEGAEYKTDKHNVIDGVDYDSFGLAGTGFAVDFGATYKLRDDIILSAAVTDLGFINWKSNLQAITSNDPWEFDGFKEIGMTGSSDNGDLSQQFEDLGDDLGDLFKFYENGKNSQTKSLATTITVGAEYKFLYYDKLSFGLLSTTRINNPCTWTEARLSANIAPLSWFDLSVNGAVSTFGPSFGWMLNFHLTGINYFIGSDHTPTRVTPQYVPISRLSTSVCFGLSFNVGKYDKKTLL